MRAIPLPETLSGDVTERTIRLDSALFYIIDGALSVLIDRQRYEPTGMLTEADVKAALEQMLEDYYAA